MENWLEQYTYRITITWWILLRSGMLTFTLALLVVSFQAVKATIANPVNSLRNE